MLLSRSAYDPHRAVWAGVVEFWSSGCGFGLVGGKASILPGTGQDSHSPAPTYCTPLCSCLLVYLFHEQRSSSLDALHPWRFLNQWELENLLSEKHKRALSTFPLITGNKKLNLQRDKDGNTPSPVLTLFILMWSSLEWSTYSDIKLWIWSLYAFIYCMNYRKHLLSLI